MPIFDPPIQNSQEIGHEKQLRCASILIEENKECQGHNKWAKCALEDEWKIQCFIGGNFT
jgi:hypothetical protein